jgi:hypothetical protein
MHHLKGIFQQNSYNKNYIKWALHPKQKPKLKDKKPLLPYQKAVTNIISRLLAKCNTKTVHIPRKKNMIMLRPVKDDLGLKVRGMY